MMETHPPPDALDIAPAVSGRLGAPYVWLPVCASTNDHAAELARAGAPEGTLVVADTQTVGRGRLGRSWQSPPGVNIYLSLVLRPDLRPVELPPLTLLVGVALADALVRLGFQPRLKWPNDVRLQLASRSGATMCKVAGILAEMSTERDRVRHVVVGVGINVNTQHFDGELDQIAASLGMIRGSAIDRREVLEAFLYAIEARYERFLREGASWVREAWKAHAELGGRYRVEARGVMVEGVVADIDADGTLLLRDDLGAIHRISSGELQPTGAATPPG